MTDVSRRDFLHRAGAAGVGAALGFASGFGLRHSGSPAEGQVSPSRPSDSDGSSLRVSVLTDAHVHPSGPSLRQTARAFHHAQRQSQPPHFILNAGDAISDALAASKASVRSQWNAWKSLLAAENSLPIVHCIGNHDVWGWRTGEAALSLDRHYGKQWALEELGLPQRYYRFDRAAWRFIVLDSTHAHTENGYIARIDEEQFAWLQTELAQTPPHLHICVISHIPILSAAAYFDGPNESSRQHWSIPGQWMHIDARRLKDAFRRSGRVRLCVSGHIHLHDVIDYAGTRYVCCGAVSGNWWKGKNQEFPPAYVNLDLGSDGRVYVDFVPYG